MGEAAVGVRASQARSSLLLPKTAMDAALWGLDHVARGLIALGVTANTVARWERGEMNIAQPFIHRPVATTLLTLAVAGGCADLDRPAQRVSTAKPHVAGRVDGEAVLAG